MTRGSTRAPLPGPFFAGDNGDIQLPLRVPILPETHEVRLYDVRRCCGGVNELDLAYQVQAGQAVTAGYFGGYSTKMQDVGQKELKSMGLALSRKVEAEPSRSEVKAFQEYSRRLVRDLEGKGILRTTTESTNLSLAANETYDVLQAECFRTSPSVNCPAALLLKREEIETFKISGTSIIAAVHHAGSCSRRAFVDPPFDLLYGFRGSDECVDLLSPYEMLMHWSMVEVRPPLLRSSRKPRG
jgi:hypothetical protein